MARIAPHQRPLYPPTERMAILEVKAARGWSLEQAAKAFLVTAATIASWMGRVDEQGPAALAQLPEPVNKFPDFVRYLVQRLKTLCPMLGKVKIAQILARAGLHLGQTTVGRILKEKPAPKPAAHQSPQTKERVVTSKYPNHLWMTDLTTMPIGSGFWVSWLPFSLPQCWPFAWWIALAEDHFSRRVMGYAVFLKEPSSAGVCTMLGRGIAVAGKAPATSSATTGPHSTATVSGVGAGVRGSSRHDMARSASTGAWRSSSD
jgi:transposase InsO family protein